MKTALNQMHIFWEDKERNYLHLESQLKMCEENGTDLFLLPEMSFTGFSMNTDLTKENDLSTVKRMTAYAKQYHMDIGFGWVKDCGEKSENHYTVINRKGDVISDYVKIHPFSYGKENTKFQGGSKLSYFEICGLKFTTFICYDLRFSEVFQIASGEADVIVVAANWPQKRAQHWKCLLQARAIENQVYILGVNCVGNINGIHYSGDSCVIAPDGEIISQLSEQEGILACNLERDTWQYRKDFPVREDRRDAMYDILRNRQQSMYKTRS